MVNINKLKECGFFEMNINQQIEFLRNNNFFDLSNESKIKFLEEIGLFYLDINDDPPNIPLEPENVDYLKEKPLNAKKNQISNTWKESFVNGAIKRGILKINSVNGIENIRNLKSGAIITVNHFNPFDTFAIEKVIRDAGIERKVYKVIREGNYTNFPGKIGLYFKNDNTLPLSQLPETMEIFDEALEMILENGDLIIVCPEQSMWLDYKQPKPFKYGAFKWATLNNVPVIPTFITREETESQDYNINIGKPIIPDKNVTPKENINTMRNLAYDFCKKTYEDYYRKPVTYRTIKHENIPQYVITTSNFVKNIKNKDEEIQRF